MSISKRSLIFVFAIVTALSFLVDREAAAQNYSELEMPDLFRMTPKPYQPTGELTKEQKKAAKEAFSEWKRQGGNGKAASAISGGQRKVKEVLAAGGDVTADAGARKFLEAYTFPSMTQTDADTVSTLGEKRQDFLKNYLNKGVTGAARAKMLDFSIEKLQAHSINETLHPSARVNAIVLLSQLTERPLDRGSRQAPIVSAKAFKTLLSIFNIQDPKQSPEFVKVAAFSGIKYQLDLGSKSGKAIAPAVKGQLVASAMEFMAAPADRDADAAAYWKKRQAVQLSAILKDAKTLPALLAILNDDTARHELKLEVVKTIIKTGAMGNDPKTNGSVLVSICKFVEKSVANEATYIQGQIDQMERQAMLFGGVDIRNAGVDFPPGGPLDDNAANRGGGGFDDLGREKSAIALVELPNYQLQISRDRLRALTLFCGRAIGGNKQAGLRRNLDAKAEALARGTVSKLGALLKDSNVGLFDLDEGRDDGQPTIEEEDRERETSYADQMTKVCQASAQEIGKLISDFTTE